MTRRGTYLKGDVKRQEIVTAALEVVAEHGCRKTTNRMIADRVGLSSAGLLHHFASREALFVAVLRARDDNDTERIFARNPTYTGFIEVITHNASVPGLVQLYVEYAAEATIPPHPAHEYFCERFAWIRGGMVQVLEQACEAGEIGPHLDLEEAAALIVASADGLQVQWLLDPSIDMAERLRGLWASLRARSWLDPGATTGCGAVAS